MPADQSLRAFVHAFNQRDMSAVLAMVHPLALWEMPLLGQRLAGRSAIQAGLEEMFAAAKSCSFDLREVRSGSSTAIAEGQFTSRLHRDRAPTSTPMALVVEGGDPITRISCYLDTRGRRLWVDGPILVPSSVVPTR